MHRRRLLQLLAFSPVTIWRPGRAVPLLGNGVAVPFVRSLTAYLDTLIPADLSPSASQLGVHQRFVELSRRSATLGRLLGKGCEWLDGEAMKQGARSFAELNESRREAIVEKAARSGRRKLARRFFEATRDQAMMFYYTRPESWPSLGYTGPPQPRGFPDYTQPMKTV